MNLFFDTVYFTVSPNPYTASPAEPHVLLFPIRISFLNRIEIVIVKI